jgi:Flp pilus assembly protein TadG
VNRASRAPRDERGAGMVSSLAGLTVFLLFLLLAVQVLVGLYATSTIRATLHDAASRAAAGGAGTDPTDPADLARLSAQAEASLGAMGDHTDIELRLVDDDGDGTGDVVAGEAVSVPPRFVPRSVGGALGFEEIRASVRVRVERFR